MDNPQESSGPDLMPPGEPRKLHPAIKKVWQISAALSTVVYIALFSIPELIVYRRLDDPFLPFPWIGPVAALLLGAYTITMAGRQYENWRYTIRPHDVILSHGVLWKTQRCVSRGRIQHVDINSGPLDRRFGLVQVSLYAAGALGAVGSIPGLRPEEAEALREALLQSRAADA